MQNKLLKNETGRSMVEMLGVLAVMGVLSVAGIAGYNTAMQSYRTNEILNATSMFYVLAMSQNQGNGPSGKITYPNVGGTNPSGATLEYENNAITITFNDAKDCTMAKNKLGDKATGECPTLTLSFEETAAIKDEETPEYAEAYSSCMNVPPYDEEVCKCFAHYRNDNCSVCTICYGNSEDDCSEYCN